MYFLPVRWHFFLHPGWRKQDNIVWPNLLCEVTWYWTRQRAETNIILPSKIILLSSEAEHGLLYPQMIMFLHCECTCSSYKWIIKNRKRRKYSEVTNPVKNKFFPCFINVYILSLGINKLFGNIWQDIKRFEIVRQRIYNRRCHLFLLAKYL